MSARLRQPGEVLEEIQSPEISSTSVWSRRPIINIDELPDIHFIRSGVRSRRNIHDPSDNRLFPCNDYHCVVSVSDPTPDSPNLSHLRRPFPFPRRRNRNDQAVPSPNNRKQVNPLESTQSTTVTIVIIFISSLIALSLVYMNFPNLDESEKKFIKLPWNIEDAKSLGLVLSRYKDKYFFTVLVGISVVYILSSNKIFVTYCPDTYFDCQAIFISGHQVVWITPLQTFAIPGSIFLSIMSGFLFPFPIALMLICSCSALGASLCYLLSQLFGRRIVCKFFPERAAKWAATVDKHKDNLLNYILFLRMTPLLPNWFINLVAPVIGVPVRPFAIGTFFGVAPPSFIAIQAGQTLHKMTSSNDAFSFTSIILLCIFAFISLIPVVWKKKFQEKLD